MIILVKLVQKNETTTLLKVTREGEGDDTKGWPSQNKPLKCYLDCSTNERPLFLGIKGFMVCNTVWSEYFRSLFVMHSAALRPQTSSSFSFDWSCSLKNKFMTWLPSLNTIDQNVYVNHAESWVTCIWQRNQSLTRHKINSNYLFVDSFLICLSLSEAPWSWYQCQRRSSWSV